MKLSSSSSSSSSIWLSAFLIIIIDVVSAYEIGCIYPVNMPDPFVARPHLHQYSGSFLISQKVETPVIIHLASLSALCQANCLAYQDSKVLNAITKQRPMVSTPVEYHDAWSRMLCIAQCFDIVSQEAGRPDFYKPFWEKWGLIDLIEKRRLDIGFGVMAGLQGNPNQLKSMLEADEWNPFTVGQAVASEILLHVMDDGWNALGTLTYDEESGEAVECTANCMPYKDTTGYYPRNHPIPGLKLNSTTKYLVEGNNKYWRPLVDTDEQGFFSAQEHVVPHIGYKAKTKLYDSVDDFPQAPDPDYDYYSESLQVVDRLRETSTDTIKKQKINFYDTKLLVINAVDTGVRKQFASDYSFEEELLFIEGLSAGEYDATLMAWREKVRHDLVRPTTIIQRWGNDQLNTFSGNKMKDKPETIAARDFQAFQRVMPHSEYPSGSSCICTAYAEFTDAYTKHYYNGKTLTNIKFGGKIDGYGCNNDEVDPPIFSSIGCDDDFEIPDMTTMLHECSQSRLWAGFHFTNAVTEGEKLCAGIGLKSFDHVQKLRNGSTLGKKFYQGDPRPKCSIPGMNVQTTATNGDGVYTNGNGVYTNGNGNGVYTNGNGAAYTNGNGKSSAAGMPLFSWTIIPLLMFFSGTYMMM